MIRSAPARLAAGLAVSLLLLLAGCNVSGPAVPAASPVAPVASVPPGPSPAKLSFNTHVQPILAEYCYACHGVDGNARKAELRLDRAEAALAKRKDGPPAIIPGRPDESPLIQRILSKDEKKVMPPPESHKTLSADQVAVLRRWVAEGAEYEPHWAFLAPRRPAVPAAVGGWGYNSIDRFVGARLAREGLSPSPEADRRSLVRRVTLDLTGLLPSPAEVEAFVADPAPDAYGRLVDRLLASPRFGEHRGRYWLDYVRYADTHGIHFDNYRAIWPYRDYVIRAFNANKPFDRFVREQLAGDLLPARTFDELAATGYMRSNLTTNEGGTITEEVFVNQTRDRVEAFGAAFLGLTTGCAACHDHKFDPFSQEDFYGLAAFLSNTAEKPWDLNLADTAPVLRLPPPETRATAEAVLAARADLQRSWQDRLGRARELTGAWLASGARPELVPTDGLELRLRLDEGAGDVLHNQAPGAKVATFKADTNPLVWGENSWLWPSMRMDILSRVNLGGTGDVEAGEKFSTGGWLMLRAKPGGGIRTGTGNGTLLARMGDEARRGGAGWDLAFENGILIVSLVPAPEDAAGSPEPAAKAEAGKPALRNRTAPLPAAKRGLQVATRSPVLRDEWLHVFFTYDGSRRASGLKVYVNGRPVDVDVKLDALGPKDSIRTDAAMHLGRRDDYQPLRETRFQDVRFYRRALPPAEVSRLPYEDVAAEIVARQPDPARWTTDEAFVAAQQFFLREKDASSMALASAVAAHDAAFDALTRDGTPTLIAAEKPSPAYADILKRGDYFARVRRVGPQVPHFLPPLPAGAPVNRRGLADWLLAPEQPLTARVTVNRMWQEVFGRGLVESAGDLGIMGDQPSHPELLDWLAVEFRESGWDVKAFYRLLVTSAAYRQSAAATPERLARDASNRLLSRGPRFRMDAEVLRDNALLASGLLVEKLGGPSVKPYQPAGVWEEVAMPESNTKVYVADKGEGLYRRSLYTFWKRASPPANLETFDATSREVACTRRTRSNTPLQAFVTMNDPQWVEAARHLGAQAIKAAASREGRFDHLARATLGRPLGEAERAALRRSAESFERRLVADPAGAKALLAVGDSPTDPALPPAELATWTLVASQFLNLDEFLTK